MSGVIQQELPKAFGQDQKAYTTLESIKNSKKDKREDVRQEFEKQMDGFLKMYISSLQNQDPFSEKSQTDSGVQIAGQMAQMQMFGRMNDQLAELVDNLAMSQILKATEFQGQEVSFDDNIRDFNGSDVTFDYELKYPSSVKSSSSVKCNVKIYDEKDALVYNGKSSETSDGKNKFVWNGRNTKGELVPHGKYRIELTASANAPDGSPIGIEATTYKKGMVSSIEMTEDGKIQLVLADGSKIDQAKVKRLTDPNAIKAAIPASSNELVGHIGKQVSFDLSSVVVKNGKGEVTYNNKNPVENPGVVTVEIWQNQKFVKKIDYAKLEAGFGKLQLDATNLEDGKYNCKIFVEDKDNEDTRVELVYIDTIDVSGVDVAKQTLKGNGKEYSVSNITSIAGKSSEESSLITKSSNYMGKNVIYEVDDSFTYDGGDFSRQVSIPKPPQGSTLSKATLEIYKGENIVARVEKAGADLYAYDAEPVPFYNNIGISPYYLNQNGFLSRDDRREVKQYIQNVLRIPGVNNYAQLDMNQKLAVNKYIEQEFRAGNFFKDGQDRANEATKLKNMGIVKFDWDGSLLNGANANEADQYSYRVNIETRDNANVAHNDYIQNEKVQSTVRNIDINNGHLELILANGDKISADQVLALGS